MKKIGGLEILKLIPEWMPIIASVYDCGPLPMGNGKLWNEKYDDAYNNSVFVKRVDEHWLITYGSPRLQYAQFLSKTGWVNGFASYKECKFSTAEEAITFYFSWKEKTIKSIEQILKDNPNAILNLEDFTV